MRAVPRRMLQRALDSWRAQLAVLGGGVLVLGPLLHHVASMPLASLRLVVAAVALLVLVAASLRAAAGGGLPAGRAEVGVLCRMVPWLLVQAAAVCLPLALLVGVSLLTGTFGGLLMLVLVPAWFPLAALTFGAVLLAVGAVACGERAWWPQSTFELARSGWWQLAAAVVVGTPLVLLAALPVVLSGFVLLVVGGWLGWLGTGLAAVAAVPVLGCAAAALREGMGGSLELAPAPASVRVQVRAAAEAPAAVGWHEAGRWQAVVEPGSVWGTWLRLPGSVHLSVQLGWGGSAPAGLALVDAAGGWTPLPAADAHGVTAPVLHAGGDVYLQVQSHELQPTQLTVAVLVHAAAAA